MWSIPIPADLSNFKNLHYSKSFQTWIFGAFVIAVSLIVIDVTAGGAPELCDESVAAAMVHTNISDSVVAN